MKYHQELPAGRSADMAKTIGCYFIGIDIDVVDEGSIELSGESQVCGEEIGGLSP